MLRTLSAVPARTLSPRQRTRRPRPRRLRLESLEDRTVPATPDAVSFESYFGNGEEKGSGVFLKRLPTPFSSSLANSRHFDSTFKWGLLQCGSSHIVVYRLRIQLHCDRGQQLAHAGANCKCAGTL